DPVPAVAALLRGASALRPALPRVLLPDSDAGNTVLAARRPAGPAGLAAQRDDLRRLALHTAVPVQGNAPGIRAGKAGHGAQVPAAALVLCGRIPDDIAGDRLLHGNLDLKENDDMGY